MSDIAIENYAEVSGKGPGASMASGHVVVGPRPDCRNIIRITGVKIADPSRALVFFQPRANENSEMPGYLDFNDMWTIRTCAVETDHITIHLRRSDSPHGWALQLRLDVLIIQ